MKIVEITENKKDHLSLLLLADEQEDMIDRYLERGRMYVLEDGGVKSECVVTDEGDGVLEIKSLATVPEYQGRGYGKALIEFILAEFKDRYAVQSAGVARLAAALRIKAGLIQNDLKMVLCRTAFQHGGSAGADIGVFIESFYRIHGMIPFCSAVSLYRKPAIDETGK